MGKNSPCQFESGVRSANANGERGNGRLPLSKAGWRRAGRTNHCCTAHCIPPHWGKVSQSVRRPDSVSSNVHAHTHPLICAYPSRVVSCFMCFYKWILLLNYSGFLVLKKSLQDCKQVACEMFCMLWKTGLTSRGLWGRMCCPQLLAPHIKPSVHCILSPFVPMCLNTIVQKLSSQYKLPLQDMEKRRGKGQWRACFS